MSAFLYFTQVTVDFSFPSFDQRLNSKLYLWFVWTVNLLIGSLLHNLVKILTVAYSVVSFAGDFVIGLGLHSF